MVPSQKADPRDRDKIPYLKNEAGKVVKNAEGKKLKDLPTLPQHIALDIPGQGTRRVMIQI